MISILASMFIVNVPVPPAGPTPVITPESQPVMDDGPRGLFCLNLEVLNNMPLIIKCDDGIYYFYEDSDPVELVPAHLDEGKQEE
jgi:hypothetical protein